MRIHTIIIFYSLELLLIINEVPLNNHRSRNKSFDGNSSIVYPSLCLDRYSYGVVLFYHVWLKELGFFSMARIIQDN